MFLLAFLFVISAFSQVEKGYFYLKNGTIVKGKYQLFNGEIHIKSAGNFWVFEPSEVDSITKNRERIVSLGEKISSVSPFFYRFEAGLLVGNSQNDQSAPFSLQGSANYEIVEHFSAGLGFGAEFLRETYLPVFLNFEYKIKNSDSSPYLFLKGGYEVALEDGSPMYYNIIPLWSNFYYPWYNDVENEKAKGGLMLNPGVGYSRMFAPGLGISLAFGYQFHRLHYKVTNDYRIDVDYSRLTIKIGIIFK